MECRHSSSEEGGSQGLIQRFGGNLRKERASLVAQLLKNLPEMWVTWVQFLVWEDPLEKGQVPTSVFWPGELHGLYSPWGRKESDMTEQLSLKKTRSHSPKDVCLYSGCRDLPHSIPLELGR